MYPIAPYMFKYYVFKVIFSFKIRNIQTHFMQKVIEMSVFVVLLYIFKFTWILMRIFTVCS